MNIYLAEVALRHEAGAFPEPFRFCGLHDSRNCDLNEKYGWSLLFLFEFWYLPATLTPEATPVAFTEVAGRITVLLPNRALSYTNIVVPSHIITSFLDIVTSRDSPSGLLFEAYCTALA